MGEARNDHGHEEAGLSEKVKEIIGMQ